MATLDDQIAGDPPSRCLAAEPGVDGRADIGELTLVNPSRRVSTLDVREQERVLPRVVGRRSRGVAAVI